MTRVSILFLCNINYNIKFKKIFSVVSNLISPKSLKAILHESFTGQLNWRKKLKPNLQEGLIKEHVPSFIANATHTFHERHHTPGSSPTYRAATSPYAPLATQKCGHPQSMLPSHLLAQSLFSPYLLMTQMDVAIPNFSSELQAHLSKCLLALSPGMSHRHLKCNVCKTEPMKQAYVKVSSSVQMLPPSIYLPMLKSWCVLNHNSHVLSVTNVCWCCLRNLLNLSLLPIVIVTTQTKALFSLPSCILASSNPFTTKLPEWCVNVNQLSFLVFQNLLFGLSIKPVPFPSWHYMVGLCPAYNLPIYLLSPAHYDPITGLSFCPSKKPNSFLLHPSRMDFSLWHASSPDKLPWILVSSYKTFPGEASIH